MGKNRSNLADVAALAGVSKAAASAVLGRGCASSIRVAETTASAIRAAAKRLGYSPDPTARALTTGRVGSIGFLLSSAVSRGWANPYYAAFLPGVEASCRAAGHTLCIASAPLTAAGGFITSPLLAQRRIDALLVTGELSPADYAALAVHGLPYVVLSAPPGLGLPVVDPLPQITYLQYLAARGHRRIWVTRDRPLLPLGPRIEAELERLRTADVSVEWCVPPANQHPNWEQGFGLGRCLFARWAALPEGSRASVIVGNAVLHEVLHEARLAGVECPRDLQLFGDNDADFQQAIPRFSRVCVDVAAVGTTAVDLVLAALKAGTAVDPAACVASRIAVTITPGETTR